MIELQAQAWPLLSGNPCAVREKRAGYRRDWYREHQSASGDHPVSARVDERLLADARHRARWRRILELGSILSRRIDPELLPLWLELEALLNERAQQVAAEHYNEGVEAGLARSLAQRVLQQDPLDPELEPGRALRVLADVLTKIAERLPR